MRFQNAFIPYGCYWSTPFCKWRGHYSHLHSMKFAARIAGLALKNKKIPLDRFGSLYLGYTVPQKSSLYGASWMGGMLGAKNLTGPIISQACATAFRVILGAAVEVESGYQQKPILAILCDRTSHSPHVYYPNPMGIGGMGESEDWVWDSFIQDPFAGVSMLQTAENVAKKAGIERAAQEQTALIRYNQYLEALEDNSAFHKRFMITPIEVKDETDRKVTSMVTTDVGVYPTTVKGLSSLKPVIEGGSVTFGTQTYPADGNAGLIITSRDQAQELSQNPDIQVRLLSFGEARVEKGLMPMANLPASQQALDRAGLTIKDIKAIKTHNPFAVNDVYLAWELGLNVDRMNRFGSSLVWGHPQAPTGARSIIELIEQLAMEGGGYGLYTGCAAGDTAAALVVKVD